MSDVVFDGILKIKLSDEQISFIEQLELPSEAVRLKKKYLHVTLIHQSFLKPYKTILKNNSIVLDILKKELKLPPNLDSSFLL